MCYSVNINTEKKVMKNERTITEYGHTEVKLIIDSASELPEWATEADIYLHFAYVDDEYVGQKSGVEFLFDTSFDYHNMIDRVTIFRIEKSDKWIARDEAVQADLERKAVAAMSDANAANEALYQFEYSEINGNIQAVSFFAILVPIIAFFFAGLVGLAIASIPGLICFFFLDRRKQKLNATFNKMQAVSLSAQRAAGCF